MRLALTALFVVGLIAAAQGQAQAQAQTEKPAAFYLFEGITYSKMHGDLAARGADILQIQVGLGYQPENSLWAYELMGRGGGTLEVEGTGASLIGWGLRAKRLIPLSRHFQLYGRAGVTENLLTDNSGPDLVGFGFEYGAGAMASFRVRALGFLFWPAFFLRVGPKVNVSLWADLGGELGNMHAGHNSSSESYNYRTTSASYGLNLGGRF